MNGAPADSPEPERLVPETPTDVAPSPGRGGALRWLAWVLLAVFAVSRFVSLTERPLHHDEGVNAWKTEQLIERGWFQYDPTNYHGPTLFFFQLLPTAAAWALRGGGPLVAGLTEGSLRVGVALAGCLLLVGIWSSRRVLGEPGALCALLLLGTSPGLLYYSRDFIHETLHVLFTLGLWLALAAFVRGADRGATLGAAAALALGFSTKETFPIGVAGIAFGGLVAGLAGRRGAGVGFGAEVRELALRLKRRLWDAALLAGIVWFLLFSSFFLNMRGPVDSLRAFSPWADTAAGTGHDKVWHWYLTALLWPWERGLVLASAFGLVLAVALRDRVGLCLATWSAVVLGAYSAIPYKTPWLVLNALLPMGLLGGWATGRAVQALVRRPAAASRALAAVLGAGLLAGAGWQARRAWQLVYIAPDEPSYAYVYVQTRRDVRRLLARIEAVAAGRPADLAIDVVAPDYWPLPFYLKPYQARFWGSIPDGGLSGSVVLASPAQESDVTAQLGPGWTHLAYDLRPGVRLVLFTRADGG